MTGRAWTCRQHNTIQTDDKTWCPSCMAAFQTRQDVSTMTVGERITELAALESQLTIPFDNLHERITELMGRDVWTHELAYPEHLYEELRKGEPASMTDIVGKLPKDVPVIVVSGGGK